MKFIPDVDALTLWLEARFAGVRIRRVQLGGVALVLLVHLLALWVLSRAIVPEISPPRIGELHMVLLPENPRVQPDEPPPVELADVPPPEIVIDTEPGTAAISALSPADVLAPRPDPSHPNEPPRLSPARATGAKLLPVLLQVLVMEDGAISMAKIMRSCGDTAVDDSVAAYVKANWRFLPALVKQQTAIQYWTTVAVRLEG